MDSVETLSKTGHVIGQIVTNEVTTKDDTIDWTIAFMDETDRKIAAHGAGYVVEGSKKIAADETLTEEEKIAQIQALVENKFVAPNFDKTVGYTFNDESVITLSQEDGADFISDAIITGILMYNFHNGLRVKLGMKNYALTLENANARSVKMARYNSQSSYS